MATCDVHPDPASLSDEDFFALMHNKLPPYVVKCMLAAGFDVVEVVAPMDLSDKPGNSIDIIETFFNQHFSGNNEYTLSLKPFVFLYLQILSKLYTLIEIIGPQSPR